MNTVTPHHILLMRLLLCKVKSFWYKHVKDDSRSKEVVDGGGRREAERKDGRAARDGDASDAIRRGRRRKIVEGQQMMI